MLQAANVSGDLIKQNFSLFYCKFEGEESPEIKKKKETGGINTRRTIFRTPELYQTN